MIGRIVSALAGRSVARNFGGAGGGMTGAAIGAALPTLARRVGPMGMIAAAAGGYAIKKMMDKQRLQKSGMAGTTGTAYRSPTGRGYR